MQLAKPALIMEELNVQSHCKNKSVGGAEISSKTRNMFWNI